MGRRDTEDRLPKLRLKITTLAPLLLAPKAIALPAPPAPTSTNNFPAMGEACEAWPLVILLSVIPNVASNIKLFLFLLDSSVH